MVLTARRAQEILYAAHEAWNRRDADALLALYADDFVYWNNFGGPNGAPLTIHGREDMRAFLAGLADFDALSVVETFQFRDGVGHATSAFFMKDPTHGITHSAVFRQVVAYKDEKIFRLEEYHDAAAFAAFMALLQR
jgi:ketosteroid isomerase-like protein